LVSNQQFQSPRDSLNDLIVTQSLLVTTVLARATRARFGFSLTCCFPERAQIGVLQAGRDGKRVDCGQSNPSYPSSSPYVLAVGGTQLTGAWTRSSCSCGVGLAYSVHLQTKAR
jgi:hypothetical protein